MGHSLIVVPNSEMGKVLAAVDVPALSHRKVGAMFWTYENWVHRYAKGNICLSAPTATMAKGPMGQWTVTPDGGLGHSIGSTKPLEPRSTLPLRAVTVLPTPERRSELDVEDLGRRCWAPQDFAVRGSSR